MTSSADRAVVKTSVASRTRSAYSTDDAPAARIGSATETAKSEIAASAIAAVEVPSARVNWSAGSSPKSVIALPIAQHLDLAGSAEPFVARVGQPDQPTARRTVSSGSPAAAANSAMVSRAESGQSSASRPAR